MKKWQYWIIVIFAVQMIIGGIISAVLGFPFFELKQALEKGGITVVTNQLRIDTILPNSPAAKAGLQVNDIIQSVNGKPVSLGKFSTEIKTLINQPVILQIVRNQTVEFITVTPTTFEILPQGGLGIAYSPISEFKQIPPPKLIPTVIYLAYSDNYGSDRLLNGFYNTGSFFRLRTLLICLINTVVGIALIKLKKITVYIFSFWTVFSLIDIANYGYILIFSKQACRPTGIFSIHSCTTWMDLLSPLFTITFTLFLYKQYRFLKPLFKKNKYL